MRPEFGARGARGFKHMFEIETALNSAMLTLAACHSAAAISRGSGQQFAGGG
jgi:hypothetical protein